MDKLELLKDFTGVMVTVYGGCSILIDLDRTGNILHNRDNSVQIDMTKFETNARSTKGAFKSLMNYVIGYIWDECPESNETEQLAWVADEEHSIYVHWNKEPRHVYNYKDRP